MEMLTRFAGCAVATCRVRERAGLLRHDRAAQERVQEWMDVGPPLPTHLRKNDSPIH